METIINLFGGYKAVLVPKDARDFVKLLNGFMYTTNESIYSDKRDQVVTEKVGTCNQEFELIGTL